MRDRVAPAELLRSCAVASLVLVGFNLAISGLAYRLPHHQLLQRIDAVANETRVVFLGDSQTEADVNAAAFSSACSTTGQSQLSINVGLGATKASEHCLVLEYLLARAPAVDTVFYGFYDNLLTEPVPSGFREITGNRALLFAFAGHGSRLLFPEDLLRRTAIRAIARVPMVTERGGLWARVERWRRMFAGIGLPLQEQNRFGRSADFASIEPEPEEFTKSLAAAVGTRKPLNDSVHEILRLAAQRQAKIFLVAMPVPAAHRERFYSSREWQSYRNYISNAASENGARFIDASDWLEDASFEDPLHANPAGATVFSTRLAEEICVSADRRVNN